MLSDGAAPIPTFAPPPQRLPVSPVQRSLDASGSGADFSGEQRAEQIAGLRAQQPFLSGKDRAELERDLAILLRSITSGT